MQSKTFERYFFFGLLLATLIFVFMIIRPFWVILVLGGSFSIVLYPVYAWLKKAKLPSWLASAFTLVFFVLVLCIPLFGIGTIVFNQSQQLYHNAIVSGGAVPALSAIGEKINSVLPYGLSIDFNEKVSIFLSYLTNNIASIFTATATFMFSFIILLFTIFYFLKDGENWKDTVLRLSPLSTTADEKIMSKLSRTINGVLRGYLLMAVIQGVFMGVSFAIFKVPNAAIWGTVAGVASIIPPMGTAVVGIPAAIYLYATGHTALSLGLFLWAVVMTGVVDNFLNPYIVGHKINIPPFLILFTVLGGITLLGPVGILIGPLAVSLLYTLAEIYQSEFK
jgi:predicted PurR-regulated permease PerM